MQKMASQAQKRQINWKKNPMESLADFPASAPKSTSDTFKDLGGGIVNQLFGVQESTPNLSAEQLKKNTVEKTYRPFRKEFTVFNYNKYYEQEVVKNQIKQLTEMIKKEIKMFKVANASMMEQVKDIENLSIAEVGEKIGVYHIRFMELVLSLLQTLRQKIGESRTWMTAMMSKKKKRGSAFAVNSKKKGTQYSLSQELSVTRQVQ